ncbi:DUF6199 family natural product biosynthesis protein [Streptomyces sp. RFCAC02]|uniref:DUF6199 family natural product biosynthesis protein n=1 Tax=Streptomyces sp. RFCAC02 TaxID=2499143 RepID=UPI00143D3580|nr:DUF6199 family natural product biosynthesis protein [Streptomyces sp. RFCAC02]
MFSDTVRDALAAGPSGGAEQVGFFVVAGVIMVVALVQLIRPQLLWKANRPFYRDPDANEPSRAGYVMMRVMAVGVLAMGAFIITRAL